MSSLARKREALLADLLLFPDPLARLDYLIDEARAMEPLSPALCTEENRVQGCMSNLWFLAETRESRCFFRCEADSLVVKSIAGLLCRFYSGALPAEILALDPSFLREAGITEHLSSNRRNALIKVWARIREAAEKAGLSSVVSSQ
jgi:cysteine desulfuration protein SufE